MKIPEAPDWIRFDEKGVVEEELVVEELLEEIQTAFREVGGKVDHLRKTIQEAIPLWKAGATPPPTSPNPIPHPPETQEAKPADPPPPTPQKEEESPPPTPDPPEDLPPNPAPDPPEEPPAPVSDQAARLQPVSGPCECGQAGCAEHFAAPRYVWDKYRRRGLALVSRSCPHPLDPEQARVVDDHHAEFRTVRFTRSTGLPPEREKP